jgi:hypothetical protein
MPNKTRFVIDADRTYVVKLENSQEVEVTGLDIIQMAESLQKIDKIIKLHKLDETGKASL